jgi:hypothetical protein
METTKSKINPLKSTLGTRKDLKPFPLSGTIIIVKYLLKMAFLN